MRACKCVWKHSVIFVCLFNFWLIQLNSLFDLEKKEKKNTERWAAEENACRCFFIYLHLPFSEQEYVGALIFQKMAIMHGGNVHMLPPRGLAQ